MKGLNKLGKVITKILEVFHWVGAALMTAATVCSAVAPDGKGKGIHGQAARDRGCKGG